MLPESIKSMQAMDILNKNALFVALDQFRLSAPLSNRRLRNTNRFSFTDIWIYNFAFVSEKGWIRG